MEFNLFSRYFKLCLNSRPRRLMSRPRHKKPVSRRVSRPYNSAEITLYFRFNGLCSRHTITCIRSMACMQSSLNVHSKHIGLEPRRSYSSDDESGYICRVSMYKLWRSRASAKLCHTQLGCNSNSAVSATALAYNFSAVTTPYGKRSVW